MVRLAGGAGGLRLAISRATFAPISLAEKATRLFCRVEGPYASIYAPPPSPKTHGPGLDSAGTNDGRAFVSTKELHTTSTRGHA